MLLMLSRSHAKGTLERSYLVKLGIYLAEINSSSIYRFTTRVTPSSSHCHRLNRSSGWPGAARTVSLAGLVSLSPCLLVLLGSYPRLGELGPTHYGGGTGSLFDRRRRYIAGIFRGAEQGFPDFSPGITYHPAVHWGGFSTSISWNETLV